MHHDNEGYEALKARVLVLEVLRVEDIGQLHRMRLELSGMNQRLWLILAGLLADIIVHFLH